MATALTLQVPDHVYDPILKQAHQFGKTPEQMIAEWLEKAVARFREDPLLQMAGEFESDVADVGGQHDFFIGQSLKANHE